MDMNAADDLIRRRYERAGVTVDMGTELSRFTAAIDRTPAGPKRSRKRPVAVGVTCIILLAAVYVAASEGIRYWANDDTWIFGETPVSSDNPTATLSEFEVHLGSPENIVFAQAWKRIADAGGFDAHTATFDRLDLSFTPLRSLVRIGIQGGTTDERTFTVDWDGTNGLEDQTVVVTCEIRPPIGAKRPQLGSVWRTLVAIDAVGVEKLIAASPASGAGGTYNVSTLQGSMGQAGGEGLSIPSTAKAYYWTGADLVAISPSDERRSFDDSYVYLGVFPMQLVSSGKGTDPSDSVEEVTQTLEATWFVIPSD